MGTWTRRLLAVAGGGVGLCALAAGGGWLWVNHTVGALIATQVTTHEVDFPIPFPLTDAEIAELRAERQTSLASTDPAATDGAGTADPLAGVDLDAIATERAAERGKHLVDARYVCVECHGHDFGGGTMIDDPMIGGLFGPNLTMAGPTADFTPADWDRAVRHGVLPSGTPSFMPSEDFQDMSDHELSDIITYIRTMPALDKESRPRQLGPLGKVLMATGQLPMYALTADHERAHPTDPPGGEDPIEFGRHLATVCTGCHRQDLGGGPVAAGPPDWPPAANISPHAEGIGTWSEAEFTTLLNTGVRPDGTTVRDPMNMVTRYTRHMTADEQAALWAYLRTVPPVASRTQ